MGADLSTVGLLPRREIEAQIVGPLIKAFMEEFGREKALGVAEKAILSLAREGGAQQAKAYGGNSLEDFSRGYIFNGCRLADDAPDENPDHKYHLNAEGKAFWAKDDEIRFKVLEQRPGKLSLNVTLCKFAEMYKELGIPELGYLLSCGRDFAMIKGFNPNIELSRPHTIMAGDECCDFRFIEK